MDAGKRTINDIFTGSKMLEIPFFQRSYANGRECSKTLKMYV